jgi:hypothetical protein
VLLLWADKPEVPAPDTAVEAGKPPTQAAEQ